MHLRTFALIVSAHPNCARNSLCGVMPHHALGTLRAVVSNFRESGDRAENSNFFLFAQKNPFGELFSKIAFKSSSEFLFWQKTESSKLAETGLRSRSKLCKLVHFQNARTRQRKRAWN